MNLACTFLGAAAMALVLGANELAMFLGLAVLVALYASKPSDDQLDARIRNAR